MRVSVSSGGKFHAFRLAEQMARRGWLRQLLTTYFSPRRNARGLEIPRERVRTNLFPELLARIPNRVPGLRRGPWFYWKGEWFDRWASRQLEPCDVLFGWSGFSLKTIRRARELGALTVLVRGSAHIVVQKQLLEDEMRSFGYQANLVDSRIVEKELREYELADFISVPSQFARRSFLEQGLAEGKLLVWPLGVDIAQFQPAETPSPPGHFRVLYVGEMSLRKGVPYLLEAFRRAALPGAELLLAGGVARHFAPFMRRLPPATRHLGIVRYPRLQELYRSASVFVLPSVEDGFGMVVPEAMASGLPVIVSANAGTADAVRPGVCGFIVPARDPHALAECLVRLHSDPDLRLRMGREARQRALEFTWDHFGAAAAADLEAIQGRYAC